MELRNRAVERAESAGEISSAETVPTALGAPRKTREPPPFPPSPLTTRSTATGGHAQPAGEISSAGTGRRLAVGSCQGREPTAIAELEILQ